MSQTKPLEAYTDSDRSDHEIAKERIANQLRHADGGNVVWITDEVLNNE